MIKYFSILLLLSFCSYAYGIQGTIIQTTDGAILDKWYKTIGNSAPKIILAPTLFKEQKIFIGVAIRDFNVDKKSRGNVVYHLQIKDPSGKIYFEKNNIIALNSEIDNLSFIQLSEDHIDFSFKFNDIYGLYEVTVEIEDKIAAEKAYATSIIKLNPLPDYKKTQITSKQTFSDWISNYKNNPEPENALQYFVLYTKTEVSENDGNLIPVLSFFSKIFSDNKFLFVDFPDAYESSNDRGKTLLALLAYQSLGEKMFENYTKSLDLVKMVKDFQLQKNYVPIASPTQISALWAEYDASGKIEPLLFLIKGLKDDKIKLSTVNSSFNNLNKDIILSISERLKNEDIILKYSNYILAYEELNSFQKKVLGELLKVYN